ncbi:MAG: hypothetical protein V1827_06510 [Candidatus Micrarchaeota archaeon]
MKSLIRGSSCVALRSEAPFRQYKLIKEGHRRMDEEDLRIAFSKYFERVDRSPPQKPETFEAAQKRLCERFGAEVSIVRSEPGRLRVIARLDMPTFDRKLDRALDAIVSGFGFQLSLQSKPGSGRGGLATFSRYVISTRGDGENADMADSVASNLGKLAGMLASKGLIGLAEVREPKPSSASSQAKPDCPLTEESLAASACMRLLR